MFPQPKKGDRFWFPLAYQFSKFHRFSTKVDGIPDFSTSLPVLLDKVLEPRSHLPVVSAHGSESCPMALKQHQIPERFILMFFLIAFTTLDFLYSLVIQLTWFHDVISEVLDNLAVFSSKDSLSVSMIHDAQPDTPRHVLSYPNHWGETKHNKFGVWGFCHKDGMY